MSITLRAKPSSDIWRKPPSTDAFNAATNLRSPVTVKHFRRAQLTVSASWKHLYDQGGLLLFLKGPEARIKWLKVGIEYYQDEPYVSTVGCDIWADWSIFPLGSNEATVEVCREEDINGKSLWCYLVQHDENGQIKKRQPLREIACFSPIQKIGNCKLASTLPGRQKRRLSKTKSLKSSFQDQLSLRRYRLSPKVNLLGQST